MNLLKMLNCVNPLLYKYKYRSKHDPYKEIQEMINNSSNKKNIDKKILIAPFRVASGSNLFEGNLSLLFKSRGYEVDFLLCGQSVSHCEQIDFSTSKYLRCNLCLHEQQKFTSSYEGNAVYVNHYLSSTELKTIEDKIEHINLNQLENYLYKGVPIYKPLASAIQLYFKRATFCAIKDEKIIRGYLKTIFITINALDNYFNKNKVELVLLSHGVYSSWGAVMEYCLAHSIRFVTWGREYHGAGVIAAHNDSYLVEPMHEKNSNWNLAPLTSNQKQQITDYLSAKVGFTPQTFDYVNYYKSVQKFFSKEELYKLLGIDVGKKIITLLPNIPWDGQIFRPVVLFNDINTWIYETIEWLSKKQDCVLIIRTHPAEKHAHGGKGDGLLGVLEEKYSKNSLPKNIILIPPDSPIRSINVAAYACAALLYGSTIGYETTFLKIPTILASKFFYSDKEITFDPKTKEEYFRLIDSAVEGNLHVTNERFERLLQYAYHYQFRRVMPETLMNLNGLNFHGYKYSDLSSFLGDEVINKFVDHCLTGEKFYFDECY